MDNNHILSTDSKMIKRNAFDLLMKSARGAVNTVKSAKIHSQPPVQSAIFSSTEMPEIKNTSITFDYLLQFDGGSRGNPGVSGCGSVIYYRGSEFWNRSIYLGDDHTNNYAEYYGLIHGLIGARELKIKNLLVEGDSKVIINQVIGKFNVKSPVLIPLYRKTMEQVEYFDNIEFNHIYRNKNKRADELANIAMDSKTTQ